MHEFTNIIFHSFGYKFLKEDPELIQVCSNTKVYDVRNLFDPFYICGNLTGQDQEIIDLVMGKGGMEIVDSILNDILQNKWNEVWIGCKGGRHRSVAICEFLKQKIQCVVYHHHINK